MAFNISEEMIIFIFYLAGEDDELKHKEKEYRDKLVLKLKKKDDGSKNERKINIP